MNNRKSQLTKCLEYVKVFKCCNVRELNSHASSNYSHYYISKMLKAGILSTDVEKVKGKENHFYQWYANDINWNNVDMKKCRLKNDKDS